jgi:hypothetical protein
LLLLHYLAPKLPARNNSRPPRAGVQLTNAFQNHSREQVAFQSCQQGAGEAGSIQILKMVRTELLPDFRAGGKDKKFAVLIGNLRIT